MQCRRWTHNWLLPSYTILKSDVSLPPPLNKIGKTWSSSIKFNSEYARSLGMKDDIFTVLTEGTDMCIGSVPSDGGFEDNYKSFSDHPLSIQAEMKLLEMAEKKGFLEVVGGRGLGQIPLGIVPKEGDAIGRVITDLTASGFNACIPKLDMSLPSIRDMINLVEKDGYMAKLDLKDGFFHVPLHPSIVDYFTIHLPISNKWLRWRVMSFGGGAAPFIFQGVQIEIRRLFLNLPEIKAIEGLSISFKKLGASVYIDDWFLTHKDKNILFFVYNRLIKFLSDLGFLVHPEKRAPPTQLLEIIGFEIDSVAGIAKISEKKQKKTLKKTEDFVREFKTGSKIKVDSLQSIIGILQHVSFIVKGGKQALVPMYECIPKNDKAKWTSLTKDAFLVICWWKDLLSSPLPVRKLYLDKDGFDLWEEDTFIDPWIVPHCDPKVIVITSDASSSGFAFFTGPHQHPQNLFAGLWTPAQAILSSNFREAKTIEIARSKLKSLTRGKFVLHRTDNACAMVVTNKLASSAGALKPIAATIRSLDRADKSCSAAMHIPGISNVVADFYSRLGEDMWPKVKPHQKLLSWLSKSFDKGRSWIFSGPDELNRVAKRDNTPNLIILNPLHALKSSILLAQARSARALDSIVILPYLPGQDDSSGAHHDWVKLLKLIKASPTVIPNIPFFANVIHASIHSTPTIDLFINTTLPGRWYCWRIASVSDSYH